MAVKLASVRHLWENRATSLARVSLAQPVARAASSVVNRGMAFSRISLVAAKLMAKVELEVEVEVEVEVGAKPWLAGGSRGIKAPNIGGIEGRGIEGRGIGREEGKESLGGPHRDERFTSVLDIGFDKSKSRGVEVEVEISRFTAPYRLGR